MAKSASSTSITLIVVKAIFPTNYNHTLYQPGETFEIAPAALQQLLDVSAVELVEPVEA